MTDRPIDLMTTDDPWLADRIERIVARGDNSSFSFFWPAVAVGAVIRLEKRTPHEEAETGRAMMRGQWPATFTWHERVSDQEAEKNSELAFTKADHLFGYFLHRDVDSFDDADVAELCEDREDLECFCLAMRGRLDRKVDRVLHDLDLAAEKAIREGRLTIPDTELTRRVYSVDPDACWWGYERS